MSLRRKKEAEFIHGVALREDVDPIVDWAGAFEEMERALRCAQEGDWARAHELRDHARQVVGK